MLSTLHLLIAQAGDTPPAQQPSGLSPLYLYLILAVLGYFLLLRPWRRQEQQRQTLLAGLKKNDRVGTSGGLIGNVAAVKDKEDEVTLKVDEGSNVRLRVTKSSIVRILGGEDAAKVQKEAGA